METFFSGNRYNFKIINEKINKDEWYWTLKAISKETSHSSGINNLNSILSELGIDLDSMRRRFEDSCLWKVSKREMKNFNKIAGSFLTSRKYLKYLENRLEEDRSQGEWENVEE